MFQTNVLKLWNSNQIIKLSEGLYKSSSLSASEPYPFNLGFTIGFDNNKLHYSIRIMKFWLFSHDWFEQILVGSQIILPNQNAFTFQKEFY